MTHSTPTFQSAKQLATHLVKLRDKRASAKAATRSGRPARRSLTPAQRTEIRKKTGSRCHICGGPIKDDDKWAADHILAHSAGGDHTIDNYLPAHTTCNNYRWDYISEEFQLILKLGVWLRSQIERNTPIGRDASESFTAYDRKRAARTRRRP